MIQERGSGGEGKEDRGREYKSHIFSKVSYDENFDQKILFLLHKYSKTHLQQSRNPKCPGVTPPDPRFGGVEGNNSVPFFKPFRRLWWTAITPHSLEFTKEPSDWYDAVTYYYDIRQQTQADSGDLYIWRHLLSNKLYVWHTLHCNKCSIKYGEILNENISFSRNVVKVLVWLGHLNMPF